jgi:hypothetical protein
MSKERPPRLRLIRIFLSLLVGFMAGLVGWVVVVMIVLFRQAPGAVAQLSSLPPALHAIAFLVPAVVAGYWFFVALGAGETRGPA